MARLRKAKRKRSIDILGVKHKITHKHLDEASGYYYPGEDRIEICNQITDASEYLETVLHECCHGVLLKNGITQDISLAQEHVIIDSIITFIKTNFDIEFKK